MIGIFFKNAKGGVKIMFFLAISNMKVVFMGLGTVFFGLICIIILCSLVSLLCKVFEAKVMPSKTTPQVVSNNTTSGTIVNRQEMLAAVSAAIAEDLGTDVSAIRIHSVKKL